MIDENRSGHELPDRWLRAFLAVVDAGSFTRAARDPGIGQPAVSHAVKQMEAALGSTVFSHDGGRVALTDAGRRLAEWCVTANRVRDEPPRQGPARPHPRA